MKNNKILARILALSAMVILIFALAIPCFADGDHNSAYNAFVSSVPDSMDTPALEGLVYMSDSDLMYYDTVCSGYLTTEENLTGFAGHNTDSMAVIQGDFVIDVAGEIIFLQNCYLLTSYSSNFMTIVFMEDFTLESSMVAFLTYGITIDDAGLHYAYLGDLNAGGISIPVEDASSVSIAYGLYNDYTGLHNNVPSVLFGSYDVLHPSAYRVAYEEGVLAQDNTSNGSGNEPTRSGMFGQLYNILRDAIFGKDVVLDNTQDFVLTQISTWLTYIVMLLPLLVVVLIFIRFFR